MGRQNQQRRAARKRQREQQRRERVTAAHDSYANQERVHHDPREQTAAMLAIAAGSGGELRADAIDRLTRLPETVLAPVLLDTLTALVEDCWARHWEPVDLRRAIRRETDARGAAITADAIAGQLRRYGERGLSERWRAQVADTPVWWPDPPRWLRQRREGNRQSLAEFLGDAVRVLTLLSTAPALPPAGPPPGQRGHLDPVAAAGVDERVLEKVRALLAKAEATTFPEEAETYTAKAQEMISRHRIDQALLAARGQRTETPASIRVAVDAPYESEKSGLLSVIAEANGCQAVWMQQVGFSTVVGFASDLRVVELLYTSLLVQATTAMTALGAQRDAYGRSRTRSFRQSFLTGYAGRIHERLTGADEVARTDRDAAEQATLLPVLASRRGQVGDHTRQLFPPEKIRLVESRVTNHAGAHAGRVAADQAHLHAGEAIAD